MKSNYYQSRKIFTIIILIICILFCLRVFQIDQDLPPWGVVTYQPIDEGQYAAPSINLQNFGVINPEDPAQTGLKYPVFTENSLRSNLLGNALTILGLNILGDNYYGLRVPYVLIGLINLLLFAATLRTIQREQGSNKHDVWVLLAFVVFLLIDFSYYVASRTVEPTSVRLLAVQLCTWIYLNMKNSKRLRFFLLGMISVSSMFLIYITNTVLVLAMGIVLLALWYREGFPSFIKSTLWFMIGALIGWGFGELYFRAVWGVGAIENTFTALNRFMANSQMDANYSAVGGGLAGILGLVKHAFRFFSSNHTLYNLPVLCVYLLALPVLFMRCLDKQKGELYALLLAMPLALFIQTLFFEDYIQRKFLILVPSLLSMLYLLYLDRGVAFSPLPRWMKSREVRTAWACGVAFFIVLIALYRVVLITDGTKEDFSLLDKIFVFVLGVVPSVIACALWIRFDPNKLPTKRTLCRWYYVMSVSVVLLNLGMTAQHVWLKPTYTERDAMIQIADKVDHKYVFGVGYQLGYTLYNNMLPIVDVPSAFCQYMLDTPDSYVIDYLGDDEGSRNQFDNIWFKNSNQSLLAIESMEREFSTWGEKREMALFQLAPKAEIVEMYRRIYASKRDKCLELVNKLSDSSNLTVAEKRNYQILIDKAIEDMVVADNVYPDVRGDILGDIKEDVYAMVYGNIYGDVRAKIYGNIYGNVYGDLYVKPEGEIFGKVYGRILYTE